MVSVIVPVYNVEEFLPDAVESVIAQSYNDWELILIDDGSTDQSAAICDRYASMHSNIKVLHQNNKGVSAARNAGLKSAQGEFIAFMDADDVIAPEYLQHLCDQQIKFNADLVGTWREFVDENLQPLSRVDLSHDACYEADSLYLLVKKNPDFFSVVWGKMYRKCLIYEYNLSFNEDLSCGEDTLFISCYTGVCSIIMCDRKKLYYYRQHHNSLMRNTVGWFSQKLLMADTFLEYVKKYKVSDYYVQELKNLFDLVIIQSILNYPFQFREIRYNMKLLHNYIDICENWTLSINNTHGIVRYALVIMRFIPLFLQPCLFFTLNRSKRFVNYFRYGRII